jgi:hypothetical protein
MGRLAIMADSFNVGDHVSDRFQQRAQGQARIVINKDRWRKDVGEKTLVQWESYFLLPAPGLLLSQVQSTPWRLSFLLNTSRRQMGESSTRER